MASVNYLYPGSGTVPATAKQAFGTAMQVAVITLADGDTTVTVVHNWGIDTAGLNRGEPICEKEQLTGGTVSPLLIVTKATNNVVFTKQTTAAGSGGTVQITLELPHSILMPND
jgi:hypothetical protein